MSIVLATDPPMSSVDFAGLLDMALARPDECRQSAQRLIELAPRKAELPSVVWQALGLAERELGSLAPALAHLRRAVKTADQRENIDRQADVRASFAATLALAGQPKKALRVLDTSPRASDPSEARIDVRRGFILWTLGRFSAALEVLDRCVPALRESREPNLEARALLTRAVVLGELGNPERAEADLVRAAELFSSTGQMMGSARVEHNRGWLRYQIGDIPGALRLLGDAAARYEAASVNEPWVEVDRCTVLLSAGLTTDALAHARNAAELLETRAVAGAAQAEVHLAVAEAALAAGALGQAVQSARIARQVYRAQGHDPGEKHAHLIEIEARWANGDRGRALLREAVRVADQPHGTAGATHPASLVAGRIALGIDDLAVAEQQLARAASIRYRGTALARIGAWLAEALRADASGSATKALRASQQGLRILDEHQFSLGATELRAAATTHGSELATLALRHLRQRPRALFDQSERWRATTLTLPLVRPPDDRELVADLGRLRDVTHKLAEARTARTSTAPLERERRRLEEAVRARTLQTPGQKETGERRFEVDRLLDSLGERRLVSIVEVDRELTVLVAAGRRVRMFSAGRLEEAAREVDYARFALRGAAGTGGSRAEVALRRLETGGPRLQEMLFGDAIRTLGDGPLIVVPPARLHATPWGVLPALRNRPFAVAPSAASWLRAVTRRAPRRRNVVLVAGPNLGSRGAEVTTLRRTYEDARVLANGAATCEDALKALNGAWLAHVAAHGVLRADNPLFSALTLDDGPLTVYDLERLRRAPYRLILSACESGIGTAAGADEVLGLASAVISLGTAGLLGSTVIVDDDAAVQVSLIVHEHLRAGADLAHALYRARQATADDPVAHATSLAFLALGAA
jgi:tetratricopeptide (TPR) repeat protein